MRASTALTSRSASSAVVVTGIPRSPPEPAHQPVVSARAGSGDDQILGTQGVPRSGYAGGAPAYGYRAKRRALVPDPDESAILARMRQWEANGLSRRAIAERLNAEGTPTKRGGRWHPTTISRALSEAAREADRQTSARQRAWKSEVRARRQAERAAVVAGVQR
jgi:hypothetical protein